ncbi:hypothetical protein BX616_002447 [Lobosporangium transversale]|uniref:SPX domain-domain-containing protein n=1 Tax=Lobosporangium transversale TaxID=64571 RepID=A0A1Y2GSI6_9FUNG|nr:SPX domain-domain-containing protein [Lobosporangium transversale]KAF9916915.1 hypothetical protein BX616_002447 [Lobosporangium transversale]ORZ21752.1 SPX domain-domain-containing protein [Lobosporangium transversale]|eukprot:XP_021883003.1 SPX domain-domain-containing protein [Lobosporangium transversale]
MKFGKTLETGTEAMPEDWRPYVIHYKSLKKKINAIVKELDDRGLPSPIIKKLLTQSLSGNMHRLEYSFDDDKQHLKTCIKVVIDDLESGTKNAKTLGPVPLALEEQLSKLLEHEVHFVSNSASSSSSDLHEQLSQDSVSLPTSVAATAETDTTPEEDQSKMDNKNSLLDLLDDSSTESFENNSVVSDDDCDTTGHATSKLNSPLLFPADADAPITTAASDGAAARDDSSSHLCDSLNHPSTLSTKGTHRPTPGTTPQFIGADELQISLPSSQPSIQSKYTEQQPEITTSVPEVISSIPLSSQSSADEPSLQRQRSSSSLTSTSTSISSTVEPIETIITPGALSEHQPQPQHDTSTFITTEEDGTRVLVIELTADTAFFDQLGEEISQLSKLQEANKREFESKVEDLSKILTVVSAPQNKDMYTWREILKVYLDAQVFVGDQEADRSTRSSEKAQKQLQWFLAEMNRSKLTHKFKKSKSKVAFNTFFQLNSELIMMKQFRELNQMAMIKILKKHDKRTNLTASSGFPKHLQNEPFYSDNISKSLTYTIGTQLLSIIPQPDDYSCPICMSVAWKPIRLRCQHVFCVRCLIKAQRKKMIHCPICRGPNTVLDADASNLDTSLMSFMELYFPKEIKEKRKESGREQAMEEMEAITGRHWTDSDQSCLIM